MKCVKHGEHKRGWEDNINKHLKEIKPKNVELHNMYAAPNIGRPIKLTRMQWAEHVAGIRDTRNA
jgi:hypothetical protein